ncbi:hypothetical protein HC931_16845 [Candidatus Gracilibacteria bacterium]|nr:hypothetical protein [Candidatus Gracilibacteria bacterium]
MTSGRYFMLRIAGRLWITIAVIHVVYGLIMYYSQWKAIAQAGWFNVIAPDQFSPIFDREDAFWFMMIAPFLMILGQLCLWADQQKLTLPISVSGILLGAVAVGLFLIPVSGFWLVLIPSAMMFWSSKTAKSNANAELYLENLNHE